MAGYNGSGTFVRTYNWVTDKGNNVKVTASRMDGEDDGFATGLSTAICKDGQTTTTAAVPFAVGINVSDGSVGTPSVKFINDTDTGFYRIGANNVGLSVGGAKVWDYGTATASVAGSVVVGGTISVSDCTLIGGAWGSYTATATAATGAITTCTTTAAYKQVGKTVFFRAKIAITTNGTGAGSVSVTLPVASIASYTWGVSGVLDDGTPEPLAGLITTGATSASSIVNMAGNYPGGDATTLYVQGFYETT